MLSRFEIKIFALTEKMNRVSIMIGFEIDFN